MDPRVVVVRRQTEYEGLLALHGTAQMAAFKLSRLGVDLGQLKERHDSITSASSAALAQVPTTWRKASVFRRDLDRFRFSPDDIVVAVGQDGLIPNVAKYLSGQPVIGVNPCFPQQKMMHFHFTDLPALYDRRQFHAEPRTMARVNLDDGRDLLALNEIFCGHRSHQSARYDISYADQAEHQSSSGLIVTTGTGATGWAQSIASAIGLDLGALPRPSEQRLVFLVREAWKSEWTGTELLHGDLRKEMLQVTCKMEHGGTIFGDGIESDTLDFRFGETATFRVAEQQLNLVVP